MTIRHRSALLDSPMKETSKSTQSNSSCNEYGDKRRTRRKKNPELDSVTLDKV